MKNSVSYNAKFLGSTDVDQPTGIDVVKEAVVKTKFSNQLKLSEGQRPAKVQIVISLDGISIIDQKTRDVLHYRPLNAISYCADDKTDKGIFTFIAKYPDSNKHSCFVFESEKSAEEITLTIGQSFDLAYQKFVESSSKDLNLKKQFLSLQKRVQDLMQENGQLKQRISDLETLVDPKLLPENDKNRTPKSMSLPRQTAPPTSEDTTDVHSTHSPYRQNSSPARVQHARSTSNSATTAPLLAPPPAPPRSHHLSLSSNGAKEQDAFGSKPFVQSPPQQQTTPLPPVQFNAFNPFSDSITTDPFGMGVFTPSLNSKMPPNWPLQDPLLRSTFSPDFSLTELDPLRSK